MRNVGPIPPAANRNPLPAEICSDLPLPTLPGFLRHGAKYVMDRLDRPGPLIMMGLEPIGRGPSAV
jgi:hypothetical protein